MALLDDVRVAIRVVSDMTDSEVQILINAALEDMRRVGIREELLAEGEDGSMDPMAHAAVLMYCKSLYGYDNSEGNRFMTAYDTIVRSMMNSSKNECDS